MFLDVDDRGAGFAFDWSAPDDLALISLRPTTAADQLMLRVLRWRDGEWSHLGELDIPRVGSRAGGFVPLEVERHKDRIVARAAGSLPITAFVAGPRGPFGLFAEITGDEPGDVQFRGFDVTRIGR